MQTLLSFLLFTIFLLLSLLHLYWALGGKWGFNQALPTNEQGERILNPSSFASAIVGFGLLLFAAYYLLKGEFIVAAVVPKWVVKYGGWGISAIFLLRALGDFRYVGFFKSIKNTNFGTMDTKLYAPLCLLIGVAGVILQIIIQ
ncbi:MAG: DUF3995 domain-containing protein [Chitinophagales bacterium]